jgi:lactate racemase
MPNRRQFLASTVSLSAASALRAQGANTVPLRTHEWFGDKVELFEFPPGWQVDVHHMAGWRNPALAPAEIRRAILNPAGTKPLREIAAGRKTVSIAFDDLTRPTPAYEVVPHLVAELRAAGIRDENILFHAAAGCHYMLSGIDVAKKIGDEAVRNHPWINHNPWENLVDFGSNSFGNQIWLDTYFAKADVKITLSGVRRHSLPGYGGGPKLILPGLAGVRTIRYNHETLKQSPRPRTNADGLPIFRVWENEQRRDMIEAARKVQVDFSVQMVYNQERRLVHVESGDIVRAHHRAARFSVGHLATPAARDADVVVVNAYPRGSQLHEMFGWGARGLKPGGSIVVINQNPMGESVWHFNDEARFNQGLAWTAQRDARRKRLPQAGQVLLYSQYLQKRELDNPYFPPEALGFRDWTGVVEKLRQAHKGDVKVAIYPYVGIQHEPGVLDIPKAEY